MTHTMSRTRLLALGLVIASLGGVAGCRGGGKPGYAVILQAGVKSPDGHARMLHALLYALELRQTGHPVVLIFDGAGTTWVEPLAKGTDGAAPLYKQLAAAGVAEVICDFCSTAFRQREGIERLGKPLTAEFMRHPSIAKWLGQGYRPLVL